MKINGFDFGLIKTTQWTIADGLGIISKGDPDTAGLVNLILGQVANPSLCQGASHRIGFTGNLEDTALTTDFTHTKHHGGF